MELPHSNKLICDGGVFQPVIRIYDIPNSTFESDDDDDDDDDEEEVSLNERFFQCALHVAIVLFGA